MNDYGRRGTSQEKSVLMSLKDVVKTDGKVYYILWKYAPDLLPKNTLENPIKTFEDLTAAYECIKPDQRICENYLMEENVQKAVKWLRSRQHKQKYNIVLKSRQLGISTVAMCYSLYLTLTRSNTTCFMMSYSRDSALEIFDKLRTIYDYLPDYAHFG